MSNLSLKGKVAIITGAASGIGEAAARLFAANGATVIIADIQDQLGLEVAASIGDHDTCTYRHCDVTDEKQVEETVDYAVATYGGLDVMYSNAGVVGSATAIADLDIRELNRIMAVNVGGMAAAIKHAARAMMAQGVRGSIVCTGSVAAQHAGHAPAGYTASKHALLGLVRSAAGEYGPHGIRVNCVSPYGVGTPLACVVLGVSPQMVEDLTCALTNLKGVVLKASHIAEAAMFLASERSEFISGHDLVVDGAKTAFDSSWAKMKLN